MSTSEFYSLFAKYSRAPKALTILSSWMDRARSTFSYFSIGRQSTPIVSINQSLSIPGSLEVIRRHDIPNDDISSTTREKTIPTSKKTPPLEMSENYEASKPKYFTTLNFDNWKPKSNTEIFPITPPCMRSFQMEQNSTVWIIKRN